MAEYVLGRDAVWKPVIERFVRTEANLKDVSLHLDLPLQGIAAVTMKAEFLITEEDVATFQKVFEAVRFEKAHEA